MLVSTDIFSRKTYINGSQGIKSNAATHVCESQSNGPKLSAGHCHAPLGSDPFSRQSSAGTSQVPLVLIQYCLPRSRRSDLASPGRMCEGGGWVL